MSFSDSAENYMSHIRLQLSLPINDCNVQKERHRTKFTLQTDERPGILIIVEIKQQNKTPTKGESTLEKRRMDLLTTPMLNDNYINSFSENKNYRYILFNRK